MRQSSRAAEKSYVARIRRYLLFHHKRHPLVITWDNGNASSYEYSVFMHTDGRPALKLHRSDWERPQYYR